MLRINDSSGSRQKPRWHPFDLPHVQFQCARAPDDCTPLPPGRRCCRFRLKNTRLTPRLSSREKRQKTPLVFGLTALFLPSIGIARRLDRARII
jgi:hypothetical protein